jgi:hypothetical protein
LGDKCVDVFNACSGIPGAVRKGRVPLGQEVPDGRMIVVMLTR